jgi:hypothetical protein
MPPRFYVDADHGLAQRAQGFEAGVAEFEAELVFAFRVERVMAFVAGGVSGAMALFSHVNFRMDLKRVHKISPHKYRRKQAARMGHLFGLQGKDLA